MKKRKTKWLTSSVCIAFIMIMMLAACSPQLRTGVGTDSGIVNPATLPAQSNAPTPAASPRAFTAQDTQAASEPVAPMQASEPTPATTPAPTEPSASPTATPAETQPSASPTTAPTPAQQKVSSSRAKISPTTQMSYRELIADNGDYRTPRSFPAKGTYRIHVDLTNQIMTVYNKSGDIVRQMLCSTGKRETPSPHGKYRMGRGRVRFGYFKDFDCYAQYWTQVTRNIYIHSVLYSRKSDKSIIRSSYRNLGKAVSHGCIRLTVPDARWIYKNIAPGTAIEFSKRSKNEALRKELKLPGIPKKK